MSIATLTLDDYAVAWICPRKVEQLAALAMLDEEHNYLNTPTDENIYFFGKIDKHNIVIASLLDQPEDATGSAARVMSALTDTFPALKLVFLVGIGSGVPTTTKEGPIGLGHVVVSKDSPMRRRGIIRHDQNHETYGAIVRAANMRSPPPMIYRALERLATKRELALADPLGINMQRVTSRPRLQHYHHPDLQHERLYRSSSSQVEGDLPNEACRDDRALERTLSEDDDANAQADRRVIVHRGRIAVGSWDEVVLDGLMREELAGEEALCLDKEAVGAPTSVPFLIIRGIVDDIDPDSRADDKWWAYGAAAAAAYARELMFFMTVDEVMECEAVRRQSSVVVPQYYS